MGMSLRKLAAMAALVCLLLPLAGLAQSIVSGDVTGTVTDPSGAVVPNAQVTIKNDNTGETHTTTSNSAGVYRFALLKPGAYTLTANATGFQAVTQRAIVAVGQATQLNLNMGVTGASQTVEVTAETPIIQTENGNISTTYNTEHIELLPNPGNDVTYVAQTAPGVSTNTSSGGGYGNFTAFGLPATSNLFTINGNDAMDPYLNLNNSGATNLLLGSNELQEATVVSNGYTGQYGRQAGAQVNYATKSGTNAIHGNLAYWWNGSSLNANDWFNNNTGTPRAFTNANQWAASIGGPIIKDKTFFFVDTEGLRYILPTSQAVFVPSPAFQAAVLNNLTAVGQGAQVPFYQNLFNLYNNAPGIAGATPVTTGDMGCGDFPIGANVPCALTFRSTAGNDSNEWVLSARVDQNLGDTDKLFLRYRTDHGTQPTFTDPINPAFNAVSIQPEYDGQLNETHVFSANAVNQFILSGSYYSAAFTSVDQATATS